ncbi:MAG: hypothetical protein ABI840_10305 [bacterium]
MIKINGKNYAKLTFNNHSIVLFCEIKKIKNFMSEAKQKILLNTIRDMPDEYISEIIDFANYLKSKKKSGNPLNLKSIAQFIINRDLNLLKRLAE